MPDIQISKIQLRRGLETEILPNSLDAGEMGFTLDSGRLFIGTDENLEGPWTTRILPPYDNVEVLTEASLETFARLFDRMNRSLGPIGLVEGANTFSRRPYLEAALSSASTSWTSVMVKRIDMATGYIDDETSEALVLAEAVSCGARIEYFLIDDSDDTVARSGVMTVMIDGNGPSNIAHVSDDFITAPLLAVTGNSLPVDQVYGVGVEFRAVIDSNGGNDYFIRLEYKNGTGVDFTLQLRAMVAARVTP